MSAATARGNASRFRAAPVQSSDAPAQERELEQTDSAMEPSRARTRAAHADNNSDTASTNTQGFDASMSDDARRRMIAETAYYIAQRRGFDEGLELEDWLAAEAEVSARLAGSQA